MTYDQIRSDRDIDGKIDNLFSCMDELENNGSADPAIKTLLSVIENSTIGKKLKDRGFNRADKLKKFVVCLATMRKVEQEEMTEEEASKKLNDLK